MNLECVQCFMFDLDGTVWLSDTLLPRAKETLDFLRARGKVMYLTNNASVSREKYVEKLARLSITASVYDVYTSATAAIDYINANMKGARVYVFGTTDLVQEARDGGVNVCEKEPELILLGFKTDLNFNDLSALCTAIRNGVPYVATHADPFCPVEGGIIPDAGAFISLIQTATGKKPLAVCGKPYAPMLAGAVKACGTEAKYCAMVGDRLSTDMEFAMRGGMTSVLVLTGDATKADAEKYRRAPDYVFNDIGEFGDAVKSRCRKI